MPKQARPAFRDRTRPTLVIVLPDGGLLGGVTSWAGYTAAALVPQGWSVCLAGPGVATLRLPATDHLRLDRWDLETNDPVEWWADSLCVLIDRLRAQGQSPVIAPQLSGRAYSAAVAAGSRSECPVVGWMHSEFTHDLELMRRFAPTLSGVACVSRSCARLLRDAGIQPLGRITPIRTGVPQMQGQRDPSPGDGPLRLIYTGRVEAYHKRSLALPLIVQRLRERGVESTLRVFGDGQSAAAFDALARVIPGVERRGPAERHTIAAALAESDAFVLPSRSEGLGLSRIEAAHCGCAPVVMEGSGAAEGISNGRSGLVIPHADSDDDEAVADRIAEALASVSISTLRDMGRKAQDAARSEFDVDRYGRSLDAALRAMCRVIPHTDVRTEVLMNPSAAARFTVPSDVGDRIAEFVGRFGRRVLGLHGAGEHTKVVLPILHGLGVRVVGIADDNPERLGMLDGISVSPPDGLVGLLRACGGRDVLLSSWMHEREMWERRAVYEEAGLHVHGLYTAVTCPGTAGAELATPRAIPA